MRTPALLAALLLAVPLGLLPAGTATAAQAPTGADVSAPQCAGAGSPDFTPPTATPTFAIVGVNAGLGTTANPCLAAEAAWAQGLPGGGRAPLELYVNTQHPSPKAARWWPRSDLTQRGRMVSTPYGRCTGHDDRACAFVYGASLADDDLARAVAAGLVPAAQRWWLDVEVSNTWGAATAGNRAVLEGLASSLRRAGAPVGVYSTHRQWDRIVGAVSGSSPLAGAATWLAGAVTVPGALTRCTDEPLVPRSRVELAQAVQTLDADVACARLARTPSPRVTGTAAAGQRLHAAVPAWSPAGVRFGYQWLRDGRPVPHATSATYRAAAADRRHRLSVRVTGTLSGYDAAVRESRALAVR